ncbi:CHAT domain-containing protein, partial [Coleofasciculus sp. LEGE 07081]
INFNPINSGGGKITFNGTSTGTGNTAGIFVDGTITSGGGEIVFTGNSTSYVGILSRSLLDSEGGTITFNGTSTGTGTSARGISVEGNIFSRGGELIFIGNSLSEFGIFNNSPIDSGGGTITFNGTSTGTGTDARGIFVNGTITSGGGEVIFTGNNGNTGIYVSGATITSGNGDLTLTADRIILDDENSNCGCESASGTGNLLLQPLNPNQSLEIGGTGDANIAFLNTAELGQLADGFASITIGRTDSNGAITLAGDVTFNDPVILRSPIDSGSIDTTSGTLTGADNATITLEASQTITTGDIINPGRDITITSTNGAIATGNLNSSGASGGTILLDAALGITTSAINSNGSSTDGGNVTLNSRGNSQVSSINAQGGSRGGEVNITTEKFFQSLDTFIDRNGTQASISTADGNGGGDITIRQGGTNATPFEVGNATTNGTTGAITSGEFTIAPFQSFPFSYKLGNIEIIRDDLPFNIIDNPPVNPVDLIQPSEVGKQLLEDVSQPLEYNSFSSTTSTTALTTEREIIQQETNFTDAYENYLGISDTRIVTTAEIQATLGQIEQTTKIKPGLIYVFFKPQTPSQDQTSEAADTLWQFKAPSSTNPQERATDQLELIVVTSSGKAIQRQVKGVTREQVLQLSNQLRRLVTDIRIPLPYQEEAQQLYQWLVAPIEAELQAQQITNLTFVMDEGLRSLPIAALHNGQGFIVEKYSVGLMPSFSLTDTRYKSVRGLQVLAMGASQFQEKYDLPAVPVELSIIASQLWQGQSFLNQAFTLNNLKQARASQPFGIIHLATHGDFIPGKPANSYIQFWNTKLKLSQLPELKLNDPPVELMVLSACRSALGDKEAELGFTGLAVQAGVKSAMGSLWYISDEGTLGFITQFYESLKTAPMKAEALRQAQLAMLRGEVQLKNGQLVTPQGTFSLPPELGELPDAEFTHPYYWSSFTLVGNPW